MFRGHFHVGKSPKVLRNQVWGFTGREKWPKHRVQAQGPFLPKLKLVWLNQGSGDPPGKAQAGRVGLPATEIVFGADLGPKLSCKQLVLPPKCSNTCPCMPTSTVAYSNHLITP